ncbi:hypothetical protein [Cryobacterium ruanii]|uniref:Uncharacterized protein n=1 Tax=Cryobacterium ruanii TaxID=1259197 RepID=A0A4R9ALM6_9MICO|nr:hypothetical protein [Cryobacterium ruanii]TFD64398.1 hypothetical protein E3T47_13135 [Cryobacterium ruanii]
MTTTKFGEVMTPSWGRPLLWVAVLVSRSALIVGGLSLIGIGLNQTWYFEPTGEALEDARVGRLLILAGAVALIAAAGWARWMHTPIWACILVAAPAALVGGLSLLFENSLFPQLSALVAFPVALAGLISGIVLARPLLRAGSARRNASVGRHESD